MLAIILDLFDLLNSMDIGFPIIVALLAIIALVYIYSDAKKERFARQNIMDMQDKRWMSLYDKSIAALSENTKEMGKTREVILELKGVIKGLYDQTLR